MPKPLYILLLVALPLAWGLLVEQVIEHYRRKRKRQGLELSDRPDDWVI